MIRICCIVLHLDFDANVHRCHMSAIVRQRRVRQNSVKRAIFGRTSQLNQIVRSCASGPERDGLLVGLISFGEGDVPYERR